MTVGRSRVLVSFWRSEAPIESIKLKDLGDEPGSLFILCVTIISHSLKDG